MQKQISRASDKRYAIVHCDEVVQKVCTTKAQYAEYVLSYDAQRVYVDRRGEYPRLFVVQNDGRHFEIQSHRFGLGVMWEGTDEEIYLQWFEAAKNPEGIISDYFIVDFDDEDIANFYEVEEGEEVVYREEV